MARVNTALTCEQRAGHVTYVIRAMKQFKTEVLGGDFAGYNIVVEAGGRYNGGMK